MSQIESTIVAWADAEVAPWRKGLDPHAVERAFTALQTRRPDIFLFDIIGTDVSVRAKPDSTRLHSNFDALAWRADQYLQFIRAVLRERALHLRCTIAMTMEDYAHERFEVPVFGFQKPSGSTQPLLPDIDSLQWDFYRDVPPDTRTYDEKHCSAIFVGSTTGGMHTVASVAALSCPRLRAGVYFGDVPEVEFRLPSIAQCISPEAEQAIRELGFGVGPADWNEQLGHRFLISMDGNGATCSRVALALRSNSVLLKYDSPFGLYYFAGLQPYVHYLPIVQDDAVVPIVRAERARPGQYRSIAEQGRQFFHDYVSRNAAFIYAGALLERYDACFRVAPPSITPTLPATLPLPPLSVPLSATLHLAELGDVTGSVSTWIGGDALGWSIEGFSLVPQRLLPSSHVEYRAITDAGAQPWTTAPAFAGSRGKGEALVGYAVRLSLHAASRRDCVYWGKFRDGSVVGPVRAGAECRCETRSALIAMMIRVTLRGTDPSGHWPGGASPGGGPSYGPGPGGGPSGGPSYGPGPR